MTVANRMDTTAHMAPPHRRGACRHGRPGRRAGSAWWITGSVKELRRRGSNRGRHGFVARGGSRGVEGSGARLEGLLPHRGAGRGVRGDLAAASARYGLPRRRRLEEREADRHHALAVPPDFLDGGQLLSPGPLRRRGRPRQGRGGPGRAARVSAAPDGAGVRGRCDGAVDRRRRRPGRRECPARRSLQAPPRGAAGPEPGARPARWRRGVAAGHWR